MAEAKPKLASHGQPAHREAFGAAIASLKRRKDRLAKRQVELDQRDEKVLVFGEPEAKPMGYGHAPKLPAYNLQSVVDVESGLIVHHDVCNDANDSHMLHPMSVAAKKVLETDELHVLTDGGYSNAAEVARCEDEAITVSAPIKRGAMNSEHFRPTQFHYDESPKQPQCVQSRRASDRFLNLRQAVFVHMPRIETIDVPVSVEHLQQGRTDL